MSTIAVESNLNDSSQKSAQRTGLELGKCARLSCSAQPVDLPDSAFYSALQRSQNWVRFGSAGREPVLDHDGGDYVPLMKTTNHWSDEAVTAEMTTDSRFTFATHN
jgi:hypothetical protein